MSCNANTELEEDAWERFYDMFPFNEAIEAFEKLMYWDYELTLSNPRKAVVKYIEKTRSN